MIFAIVGCPAHANVTAFVLQERVVLVDCGIQLSAVKEARRYIEEISGRKVEIVILTHFHSDHTHALPAFSDCRIISSNLLLIYVFFSACRRLKLREKNEGGRGQVCK